MPETAAPVVDFSADVDLISFLKAISDGRYRRGVHYPQWYPPLITVLGILSDCRSSRNLEAFAERHREARNQALGLSFKRWPTDATFLYLFNKAHLEQFGEVVQAWTISQIPGGATALDQLVCDSKTLKGSAIETADGNHRFVAQVTVYARALGVALEQKAYDTHQSSERAVLKELHTTQTFWLVLLLRRRLRLQAGRRRRPDHQNQPADALPADLQPVRGKAPDPFHRNG